VTKELVEIAASGMTDAEKQKLEQLKKTEISKQVEEKRNEKR